MQKLRTSRAKERVAQKMVFHWKLGPKALKRLTTFDANEYVRTRMLNGMFVIFGVSQYVRHRL